MTDLNNMSVGQLQDIYFKEYGYEPSSLQTREELISAIGNYVPVGLREINQ